MYKIYIKGTPLHLVSTTENPDQGFPGAKSIVLRYTGKKKFLLNIIDQLEKSDRFEQAIIFSENLEKLWSDFQSIYQQIAAAGGVVFNPQGEVLLIFRRGYWDLPKGKIEEGETSSEAALREVQEETGLNLLILGAYLCNTRHTYEEDGKRILKTTHWFLMKTEQQSLVPQHEEDIEQAAWQNVETLAGKSEKIYKSILNVLSTANTAIKNTSL